MPPITNALAKDHSNLDANDIAELISAEYAGTELNELLRRASDWNRSVKKHSALTRAIDTWKKKRLLKGAPIHTVL